jgi:hypothetical protein
MSRRQDVPEAVVDALEQFHLRLRMNQGAPAEVKMAWYNEVKGCLPPRGRRLAWALMEANIPVNQIVHNYSGEFDVDQKNNPGGTNVTQRAGGDMTGVNATGTQTIRDITIYKQDLDQSGTQIAAPVKAALVETRRQIEAADIDAALKPAIIDQFDKLTEELKKGEKKNAALASGLWNMVYNAVKFIPTAVGAVAALDKLRGLLGY